MEWLNKMEKVLSDYLGEKEKLLQEKKKKQTTPLC